MIVAKFGGTSIADAAAIRRAAGIVRGRKERRPVVVVSALAGVTNTLLEIADQAAAGNLISSLSSIEALRERHLVACEALVPDRAECDDLSADLSAMFDEIAHLAEALSVFGHLTARSRDSISSVGEQLSSHLFAAAMRSSDIPATWVDARQVMITDDEFTKARPDMDTLAANAKTILGPLLGDGRVPVLGGYIGATRKGVPTTLGRGGSDYTASLIGAVLQAEAIEIWTDVDGMLTADPRLVPDARLIEEIAFDEASELASFGARVLHPATIAPAVRRGIPVFIFNAASPQGRGTRIASDAPRREVTAIAGKRGVVLVNVRTGRMLLAHGFLRTFFEIFERHRTSVDVVATSEVSISVTVDDASHLEDLIVELGHLGDVTVEHNRGLLSVVGSGIARDCGTMARAFQALSGVRVHMASLGASGINLTVALDDSELESGMQQLHATFFGKGGS